ncbi:hypothetical protein CVV26_03260 [Candidatus Kuenenbacteria bacterium HGW-Kuenenbacteria-1]|uniref:Uncharacterized protein n=1 Tax=Candidatus Kuenenbacteria bacterium HGW-Kuenenbacteria-1 TaxID=2013812 RepID=A0A2N1UMW2_9BACT|nr:MAG: hypothetical protein CVV26_03260 [Candidatus Kuenenbacteria bacterium HGW-Kuenenbacteria-1]
MKLIFFAIKFIRYFLILFFVILIACLFWQNYVPSGYFEATQDFKTSQKFISDFYPKEKIYGNGIVEMPIYFKVRAPQYFKKAHLTIIYQNPSNIPLDLGIRKNLTELETWGLQKEDYKNKSLSKKSILNEDWQEANLTFSLENISLIDYNYEFIISASDKTALIQKIKFKKIKIILEKDPLTWQEFFKKQTQNLNLKPKI